MRIRARPRPLPALRLLAAAYLCGALAASATRSRAPLVPVLALALVLAALAIRDTTSRLLHAPARGVLAALIEAAATATAALAAVLPVEGAVFGRIPVAAVVANTLAAPLYLAILGVAQASALLGWDDAVADAMWGWAVAAPRLVIDLITWRSRAGSADLPATHPALVALGWYAVLGAVVWLLSGHDPAALESRGAGRALAPVALGAVLLVQSAPAMWHPRSLRSRSSTSARPRGPRPRRRRGLPHRHRSARWRGAPGAPPRPHVASRRWS